MLQTRVVPGGITYGPSLTVWSGGLVFVNCGAGGKRRKFSLTTCVQYFILPSASQVIGPSPTTDITSLYTFSSTSGFSAT